MKMTDKSSQQETPEEVYQSYIDAGYSDYEARGFAWPEPQPSAICEHKSTYSYSEVSELGAIAKSGMRKCVACGAEIDVRSAEQSEPQPSDACGTCHQVHVEGNYYNHNFVKANWLDPQPSAQSVELPPLTGHRRYGRRASKAVAGRFGSIEQALKALFEREDQLLAALTENASMRQQLEDKGISLRIASGALEVKENLNEALRQALAAEREAHEVTKKSKDGAYSERDKLVCALTKIFPSWLERHPDSDTTWEDDWRWIVFINLPTGQASWHIHDSELEWFDRLPMRWADNSWDGHTTEQKYERLSSIPPLWRTLGEQMKWQEEHANEIHKQIEEARQPSVSSPSQEGL